MRQIADYIKAEVPKVGSEGYAVDDFLLVSTDPGGGKGTRSFSFWGIPKAASRNRSNQLIPGIDPTDIDPPDSPPDDPDTPKPPRPPRPPQPPAPRERRSRPLPFRSVVAPNGEGKLSASIASQEDFPETWLILRVDENTDVTCDRIWQDEDVSIASLSIKAADGDRKALKSEIVPDGRAVKVRGISQNTIYELDIEYNASQELASVVGTPVFRLELHRPPNPPKDQGKT